MTIQLIPIASNHCNYSNEMLICLINKTLLRLLVCTASCNRHARRYKDDK